MLWYLRQEQNQINTFMLPPKPLPALSVDDLERFNSNIGTASESGCVPWKGNHSNKGRPLFGFNGSQQYAHRVMWAIHNGPIPLSMYVCHTCDNPICVNPDHLFLGTARDNYHDMVGKGRRRTTKGMKTGRRPSVAGSNHPRAKLCEFDVKLMRALFYQNGVSAVRLGLKFGVASRVAWSAIHGKTWSHVKYLLKG